jgi:hypothetical protein
MKLTAKPIDTIQLPTGKSELVVFDDEVAGFFVRFHAGSSRTFGEQPGALMRSLAITLSISTTRETADMIPANKKKTSNEHNARLYVYQALNAKAEDFRRR